MRTTTITLGLAATLTLVACATPPFVFGGPTSTFYKDGRPAYIASCSASQWKECLEQAGNTCREAGYTLLEKQQGYASNNSAMVFACNPTAEAPATK